MYQIKVTEEKIEKVIDLFSKDDRIWAKEQTYEAPEYYNQVYDIVYAALVASLETNPQKVFIPDGVEYTAPTTEKKFIGIFQLEHPLSLKVRMRL